MPYFLGLLVWLGVFSFQGTFAQPLSACSPEQAVVTGETQQTLWVNEEERTYILYVPSRYDGITPLPLLMSFHGFSSSAEEQLSLTGFELLAETENFIVVFPQGTGRPPRWYNGVSAFSDEDDLRDMAFVTALLDTLQETACIDETRIYATGFSAGGGMSYRLACELSDRITAIGTVAGAYSQIPNGGCLPTRPVPIITIHGIEDPIVPFLGGNLGLPSIDDWVADWARFNGCGERRIETLTFGTKTHYSDCDQPADVVFYALEGTGHVWMDSARPSRAPEWLVGKDPKTINASETLWAFLKDYALVRP